MLFIDKSSINTTDKNYLEIQFLIPYCITKDTFCFYILRYIIRCMESYLSTKILVWKVVLLTDKLFWFYYFRHMQRLL